MKDLIKFDVWNGSETTDNRRIYCRVSRWITVKHNYNPSPKNALWDYVTDGCGYHPYNNEFNPDDGLYLDYFTFDGRNYAIEQIIAFGGMCEFGHFSGYIENGEKRYLSGYLDNNLYSPYHVELDEYGEHVRVYEECRRGYTFDAYENIRLNRDNAERGL